MSTDRRRPLLVNQGEFSTDAALREAAAAAGFRVDAKVRLADLLRIESSGLTNEEYGYALRAHVDWAVTDMETTRPEFAVEFDGGSHEDANVMRRDDLKDAICNKLGLPLLRIDNAVLRPTARRTVLGYLVECHSIYLGFLEGQANGSIPEDEIWMPWSIMDVGEDGGLTFWDLSGPCRMLVARLYERGVVVSPGPGSAYRGRRAESPRHAEAYAWVPTPDGRLVVGHVRVRAYSFPAVLDMELADELAHLDLASQLSRLTEGDLSVLRDPTNVALPRFGPGNGWSGGGPVQVLDVPPPTT